jgi:hypothetical protein
MSRMSFQIFYVDVKPAETYVFLDDISGSHGDQYKICLPGYYSV